MAGIQTPEDRNRSIEKIRRAMSRDFAIALGACDALTPTKAAAASGLIFDLKKIKQKIEDRAQMLGYAERCRQAIAVCRGECCRWHFPRTLSVVDFFIAVFDLAAAERTVLADTLRQAEGGPFQCPLLRKDGCVFTFESRPVVCTSAFPCLAGTDYWTYKERFKKEIEGIRRDLGRLVAGQ